MFTRDLNVSQRYQLKYKMIIFLSVFLDHLTFWSFYWKYMYIKGEHRISLNSNSVFLCTLFTCQIILKLYSLIFSCYFFFLIFYITKYKHDLNKTKIKSWWNIFKKKKKGKRNWGLIKLSNWKLVHLYPQETIQTLFSFLRVVILIDRNVSSNLSILGIQLLNTSYRICDVMFGNNKTLAK